MYRKQVRRRRAVLVTLVVACLVLISISISEAESGPLHSIQRGVATVLSPIQDGADRALKPARDLVGWFDETWDARGENESLRGEVADLREELLATRAAAERAGYEKRVEKLVAKGDLEGYEPVGAGVVARSFSLWYGRLTIDEGSSSGVARNDPVVNAEGLIGRVSAVSGGRAQVTLITGKNAVTARVAGSGPEGLIEPVIGAPGKLRFGLIQGRKPVQDGDELVTAGFNSEGLESLYPAGIPIGVVNERLPDEAEQRREVDVKPFANLSDLERVTVLTGGDRA